MAKYVFYDDETQGAAQLICEVGMVVTDEAGHIELTYQSLVNPHHAFDSYVVRNIHHITPKMVKDSPDFKEVWDDHILPALDGGILVAHNARSADIHHIRKSLAKVGRPLTRIHYIDTMDIAKELFPRGPWKLAELAKRYGVEDPSHHRAINDADVLRQVFFHMAERTPTIPVRTI